MHLWRLEDMAREDFMAINSAFSENLVCIRATGASCLA